MSSYRWTDLDGITPWRSPGPRPHGALFLCPSPDPSVSNMLALSESIPAEVHFNAPPEEQPGPYIVVEPLGASAKTTQVRVSLVDSSGDVSEVRTLPWDPSNFDTRLGLGNAIRELAPRLAR